VADPGEGAAREQRNTYSGLPTQVAWRAPAGSLALTAGGIVLESGHTPPSQQKPVVYGRHEERAIIDGLLADARAGRGGVLVVRGGVGIGKRTLLRAAADRAEGFQVLRVAGVESEEALPFAGLHQLLQPAIDRVGELPGPRAGALRAAFGLAEGPVNRFLIELGVLSLLARMGAEQPLLGLVMDAQLLDRASVDTLAFVGRRLDAAAVVLLLEAEDGDGQRFDMPGVPSLRLGGLDHEAAGQLLGSRTGELAAEVRDRLIEETGGNPLALLEMPETLSAEQLAGRDPLPERLSLGTRLQRAFLPSVRRLPEATQTLLLLAAADDTGDLATVLAAGATMAVGADALEAAERVGIVSVSGQQLEFRHPLARSAVYQGATFMARQSAHRALTAVLAGDLQADRRAWHMAATAIGPDEEVAAALEGSAARAGSRRGPIAAASALERAATLTPLAAARARRLVAAAEYGWEAGHGEWARALLDRVELEPDDPVIGGRMLRVRGLVELAAGTPAAASGLLERSAALLVAGEPARALETLVVATSAALAAGDLNRIVQRLAPAAAELSGEPARRIVGIAASLASAGLAGSAPAGAGENRPAPPAASGWPHPGITWIWPMLALAESAANESMAVGLYAGLVERCRATGSLSALTVALGNLAVAEAWLGRWDDAAGNATEGLQLASETGQRSIEAALHSLLGWFAVQQGRGEDCRRHADQALGMAFVRRLPVITATATWQLAQLDLIEGRPEAALDRLRGLAIPGQPGAHPPTALLATGDLVEAATRAGDLEAAEPMVARLERWVAADEWTWISATAARCRALITAGPEADKRFRAALAVDGLGELSFQLARTELAYGEWLRRARRRAEARTQLRAALELFERLDAGPWIERASGELRASGETARKRDPSTLDQLTPQELQVARLATQGLRNREIAAQLLISTHTVSYHLHKVFAKLRIASRAELGLLDLDDLDELGGEPGRASG
jgi:DNA-binding CsgD family transcriptional regulator